MSSSLAEKPGSLFLYPVYSLGGRIFLHLAQISDAPLAGVLTAGGETERLISIHLPPLGPFV